MCTGETRVKHPVVVTSSWNESDLHSHLRRRLLPFRLGKWADFVVLDADPLVDIANTKKISAVYIAGNQVPR